MDCAVGEAEKKEDMEAFFLSPSFGKSSGESFFDFFLFQVVGIESQESERARKRYQTRVSKRKSLNNLINMLLSMFCLLFTNVP